MSVPVRCLLCERDFSSTEKFVTHYERTHFEVSGQYEREYLAHLDQEHLEDAK